SALAGSFVVYYDLRVIQMRQMSSTGAASNALYQAALERQRTLLRTTPVTLINAVIQLALVFFLPVFFIDDKGHLILVAIQIAAFTYLPRRTILQFKAERAQIVEKSIEELASEEGHI